MKENVLLLVLDTVRHDHLSTYGHKHDTDPFLSELANQSLVFENAFANSNWTPTSHATMFTGQLPSKSGVYANNLILPEEQNTLPELLKENGYRTFATAAGAHIRSERGFDRGFDQFHETYRIRPTQGFATTLTSDPSAIKQSSRSVTRGHDNYTYYKIDRLKKWLTAGENPFFAFVNFKTAHHSYNPPRPYKSFFSDVERPRFEFQEMLYNRLGKQPQNVPNHDIDRLRTLSQMYPIIGDGFDPTDEELEIVKSWYDGAIRYLNDQIESLIVYMENEGLLENTNIIITSDHGELFGEHGLEKHQYSLYEELLHIPLLIRTPSGTSRRIDEMVSLADLYPTILKMAGIVKEDKKHTTNLLEHADQHNHVYAEVGKKSPEPIQRYYPDFTDSEYNGPLQSIRDDQYKLIRWDNGRIEMYDWRNDLREENDLSDSKPDTADRLETKLLNDLSKLRDSAYDETVEDEQLTKKLEDLGYL